MNEKHFSKCNFKWGNILELLPNGVLQENPIAF